MTNDTPVTDPADQPPGSQQPQPDSGFWARWGELFVALGVFAVGLVVLAETQDIRVRQGVVVSPRIIPYIVGFGLCVVSIWYALDITRSPRTDTGGAEDSEDVDPEASTDWSVIGTIAIALLAYALLIDRAGFIVASTVLFGISSFAMGSQRYLRDFLIGLILSTAAFVLFDGWLGVRLPEGWLEALM